MLLEKMSEIHECNFRDSDMTIGNSRIVNPENVYPDKIQ